MEDESTVPAPQEPASDTQALPPYTEEELLKVAYAYVDHHFSVSPDIRDEAAGDFVMAALAAAKKAAPGPGIRAYQHRAGAWAAKSCVRRWAEAKQKCPVSLDELEAKVENEECSSGDEELAEAILALKAKDAEPMDILIRQEELAAVREAVAKLTGRERRLLQLNFDKSLNQRQIAKRMGISETSTAELLVATLIRLREIMPPSIFC